MHWEKAEESVSSEPPISPLTCTSIIIGTMKVFHRPVVLMSYGDGDFKHNPDDVINKENRCEQEN